MTHEPTCVGVVLECVGISSILGGRTREWRAPSSTPVTDITLGRAVVSGGPGQELGQNRERLRKIGTPEPEPEVSVTHVEQRAGDHQ